MDVLGNSFRHPLATGRERGIKAMDGSQGGIVGSLAKKLRAAAAATSAVRPDGLRFAEVLAKTLRVRTAAFAGISQDDSSRFTDRYWPNWENAEGYPSAAALRTIGGEA